MLFEHPSVTRSWLTHRICRHEEEDEEEEAAFRIETVLNVETAQRGPAEGGGSEWDELIDALTDFMLEHDDIDSVEIRAPNAV